MIPLLNLLNETDQVHFTEDQLGSFERHALQATQAVGFAHQLAESQGPVIEAALAELKPQHADAERREPGIWDRLSGELQLVLRLALADWGLAERKRCSPSALDWLRSQHTGLEQTPTFTASLLEALKAATREHLPAELAEALEPGLTDAAAALSKPLPQS